MRPWTTGQTVYRERKTEEKSWTNEGAGSDQEAGKGFLQEEVGRRV